MSLMSHKIVTHSVHHVIYGSYTQRVRDAWTYVHHHKGTILVQAAVNK